MPGRKSNMVTVNHNYLKLPGSYLFSTIGKKVKAYKEANPQANVISLGIGDVTQPLAPAIIEALHKSVDEMGDAATFHGYAPDLGYEFLRSAIAKNATKTEAVTLKQMKSLSLTVQRAIQEIFRKYSDWITRLQCVTLYTQYM